MMGKEDYIPAGRVFLDFGWNEIHHTEYGKKPFTENEEIRKNPREAVWPKKGNYIHPTPQLAGIRFKDCMVSKLREIPGFPWKFRVPPPKKYPSRWKKTTIPEIYISRMSPPRPYKYLRQSQGPQKVKRYTIVFQSSMFGRELLNFGGCTLHETNSELGACENQICWKMIVTLWDKRPMFRGSCC